MPAVLDSSRNFDVIIMGGGIIGCSIALRLAQGRLRVLVVDRGEPGGEASSAAAGMIAPQGEMVEADAFFDFCSASRDLYPTFVEEIEGLSGKEVGYRRDGTLLVGIEEQECRKLEEIYCAQSGLGLPVERLNPATAGERVRGLSPRVRDALFLSGDHWVDNERLMSTLVEACRRLGVEFRAGCEVKKINVQGARVSGIECDSGATLSAGQFVLAAGCWSGDLVAPLGISIPLVPCRGQVTEFESLRELPLVVRAGHHYLVPRSPGRVLAGTTAEYVGFDKSVTGEGLRSILEGTTRLAPFVKDFRFLRAWAGLRPDTSDHRPVLGYMTWSNLIFATGHFRNGILLAPITAEVVSSLIQKRKSDFALEAYSPARFVDQHAESKSPSSLPH